MCVDSVRVTPRWSYKSTTSPHITPTHIQVQEGQKAVSNTARMALLQRKSSSAQIHHRNISPLLAPALTTTLYLAHISSTILQRLSILTLKILLQITFLLSFTLQHTFYASKILLQHTHLVSSEVLRQSYRTTRRAVAVMWKATEKGRERLFFEFMVFILGCGNGLCLVLFWPGWILFGGVAISMWWVCG